MKRKYLMRSKSKGFSLIELLVVMAIIAILAAFGVSYYMKYIANAKYAKMESTLRQMALVAENAFAEFQVYPDGTCNALGQNYDVVCSITLSSDGKVKVIPGSGLYSFKVPPKMSVNFKPLGSKSDNFQIILASSASFLRGSTGGSAIIVIDSTTSTQEIACFDDEIHGKNWPSGCP
ncbi:MAG: type IV pilin protein [Thermodesulforhabdaceae bacterium]